MSNHQPDIKIKTPQDLLDFLAARRDQRLIYRGHSDAA